MDIQNVSDAQDAIRKIAEAHGLIASVWSPEDVKAQAKDQGFSAGHQDAIADAAQKSTWWTKVFNDRLTEEGNEILWDIIQEVATDMKIAPEGEDED